jgi:hypothetical protein
MTLTDPTGGVGYAYGAKLPSTDMTTIATQQPDAVDGSAGGTYAANITFNGTLTLANEPNLTAATYSFEQPLTAARDEQDWQGYWRYGNATGATAYNAIWWQNNVANQYILHIPFVNLPHKCELKTVSCYISGDAQTTARGGALPTLPIITVYAKTISTGLSASIGTKTDNPADLTAYKAYHILGQTALSLTAGQYHDGTKSYYAEIQGEDGVPDALGVISLVVSVECTSIYPG